MADAAVLTKERSREPIELEKRYPISNGISTSSYHPFFYFHNTTQSESSNHFSLQDHTNTTYGSYETTLVIIILLHVIYFLQWVGTRSRKDLCTNYEQVVEKKQFYKALIAISSHPPVDGGERGNSNDYSDGVDLYRGMVDEGGGRSSTSLFISVTTILSRYCGTFRLTTTILQRVTRFGDITYRNFLQPFINGHLSGLPLLAFTSHIFWQCRALEELYDVFDGKLSIYDNVTLAQLTAVRLFATEVQNIEDAQQHISVALGYTYLRVLVALIFTSLLLELVLLRLMTRRFELRSHRHQKERVICSTASLATAVLNVYNSHFPFSPPPILPLFQEPILSASGFNSLLSILILAMLTRRIHASTSVFCGLLSGSFWSMRLTSFLGTKYWGDAIILSVSMAFFLSLKSQPLYSKCMESLFPCIDYVAWNGNGKIHSPGHREMSYSEDLEMGRRNSSQNAVPHRHESIPLLSTESSSDTASDRTGVGIIRGRVPLIHSMESDIEDTTDLVMTNEELIPFASTRIDTSVLRRGGGIGDDLLER